jgi:hypothetical protein
MNNNLQNQILLITAMVGLISATRECFDDEEVME